MELESSMLSPITKYKQNKSGTPSILWQYALQKGWIAQLVGQL